MRVRAFAISLVALSAVSLGAAHEAFACDCNGGSMEQKFRWSDGAIEAGLVAVEPTANYRADFRYEVLSVYKGRKRIDEGDELVIESSRSGASCGLPGREGRGYGLFLYRDRGEWAANLCTVVAAWRMRRAGEEHIEDRRPRSAPVGCSAGSSA